MKKSGGLEVAVGIFMVLGLVALVFLALQSANLSSLGWGHKTYSVSAEFSNIGGLKPRAPVKSAGVVVGRVKSISFDPMSFQAKVVLDLESQYEFPADSSLKILTSGLLGEQYVGLIPGADDANLKNGSVISRTQSAIVLENLISQFLFNSAEKAGR